MQPHSLAYCGLGDDLHHQILTMDQSDSSKEVKSSSGSISVRQLNEGGASSGTSTDQEREIVARRSMDSNGSPRGSNGDLNNAFEPSSETEEQKIKQIQKLCCYAEEVDHLNDTSPVSGNPRSHNL
ncbi:hypothetical protein Ancab_036789 [Ancistrocladus abbreviatus]